VPQHPDLIRHEAYDKEDESSAKALTIVADRENPDMTTPARTYWMQCGCGSMKTTSEPDARLRSP